MAVSPTNGQMNNERSRGALFTMGSQEVPHRNGLSDMGIHRKGLSHRDFMAPTLRIRDVRKKLVHQRRTVSRAAGGLLRWMELGGVKGIETGGCEEKAHNSDRGFTHKETRTAPARSQSQEKQ